MGQARCGVDLVQAGEHVFADNVRHRHVAVARRIAQWPAGNGTHMLFELAGMGGLRGPVTGIVDPRRELIGADLATFHDEEFERQNPDIVEGFGQLASGGDGGALCLRRCARGQHGAGE